MTEQEKRRKKLKSDIILMIIGYVMLIFFAINFMNVLNQYENVDITKIAPCVRIVVVEYKKMI